MTLYVDGVLGNDSNNGEIDRPFKKIQTALNAAKPGDLIEVKQGNYPERLKTFLNGAEGSRITINGNQATIQGCVFQHSYITLQNFNVTNTRTDLSYEGALSVAKDISDIWILNNVIYDTPLNQYPINFAFAYKLGGAKRCIIRNNVIRNTKFNMLNLFGVGHLIQNNLFEKSNGGDAIRCFGADHIIEYNKFVKIGDNNVGIGHPDILQTFGDEDVASKNIIFRNNYVVDSDSQFMQLEQKGRADITDLYCYNNLIVGLSMAANIDMPNYHFYQNTVINSARNTNSLPLFNDSPKGRATGGRVWNNIFIGCGNYNGTNKGMGWYFADYATLPDFYADYNFVSGPNGEVKQAGPPRDIFKFYEPNGFNGGDPGFSSALPLGCSLDPNSMLIGKGSDSQVGATKDIGCNLDISKVGPSYVPPLPPVELPEVVLAVAAIKLVEPGNVLLNATVIPKNHEVKSIEFFSYDTSLGADYDGPYRFSSDNLLRGDYAFKARLHYDVTGVLDSSVINVTVLPPPIIDPKISITFPTLTSTFGSPQSILCRVNTIPNGHTINQVDYLANQDYLGTTTSFPYSFVWNLVPTGNYDLKAVLKYDADKSVNSVVVPVVVKDK